MEAEAEHKQPRTLSYLVVAGLLTVLTGMELAASYTPALKMALVPVLLVLSAAKFALVAMFYMHLRYESLAYTVIFATLLLFAMVVTFSVFILIRAFFGLI